MVRTLVFGLPRLGLMSKSTPATIWLLAGARGRNRAVRRWPTCCASRVGVAEVAGTHAQRQVTVAEGQVELAQAHHVWLSRFTCCQTRSTFVSVVVARVVLLPQRVVLARTAISQWGTWNPIQAGCCVAVSMCRAAAVLGRVRQVAREGVCRRLPPSPPLAPLASGRPRWVS